LKGSALANDMDKVGLVKDCDQLSEIFKKVDRMHCVEKFNESFGFFPKEMTLVQFLQICRFWNVEPKDLIQKQEIEKVLLSYQEIIEKIKKSHENFVEDSKKLKEMRWKEIENECLRDTLKILNTKKENAEKKLKTLKNERYKFIIQNIKQEIDILKTKQKLASSK
jgi:hypothetical protein